VKRADATVLDVEVPAPEPQHGRSGPRQQRLLDIEALYDVERAQRDQQGECDRPRTSPPAAEVQRANDQGDTCRNRECVEERHHVLRKNGDHDVTAPGEVRSQGGDEVDDSDREGDCAGDRRKAPKHGSIQPRLAARTSRLN
jgi:hypothetical protein